MDTFKTVLISSLCQKEMEFSENQLDFIWDSFTDVNDKIELIKAKNVPKEILVKAAGNTEPRVRSAAYARDDRFSQKELSDFIIKEKSVVLKRKHCGSLPPDLLTEYCEKDSKMLEACLKVAVDMDAEKFKSFANNQGLLVLFHSLVNTPNCTEKMWMSFVKISKCIDDKEIYQHVLSSVLEAKPVLSASTNHQYGWNLDTYKIVSLLGFVENPNAPLWISTSQLDVFQKAVSSPSRLTKQVRRAGRAAYCTYCEYVMATLDRNTDVKTSSVFLNNILKEKFLDYRTKEKVLHTLNVFDPVHLERARKEQAAKDALTAKIERIEALRKALADPSPGGLAAWERFTQDYPSWASLSANTYGIPEEFAGLFTNTTADPSNLDMVRSRAFFLSNFAKWAANDLDDQGRAKALVNNYAVTEGFKNLCLEVFSFNKNSEKPDPVFTDFFENLETTLGLLLASTGTDHWFGARVAGNITDEHLMRKVLKVYQKHTKGNALDKLFSSANSETQERFWFLLPVNYVVSPHNTVDSGYYGSYGSQHLDVSPAQANIAMFILNSDEPKAASEMFNSLAPTWENSVEDLLQLIEDSLM